MQRFRPPEHARAVSEIGEMESMYRFLPRRWLPPAIIAQIKKIAPAGDQTCQHPRYANPTPRQDDFLVANR
ncbi:hypothetical protein RBSWK_01416 [Rhodopirellula baltica SWK14]|uniref:Uncharacterized protein n=1 Tax=Rhodopirellula baltica SWK14 TaxID=993516 RepID=L7CK29_RHOBT|nr:hypothetical protein RBSWK_01416 [Rhodopirellula baltica SWK14]